MDSVRMMHVIVELQRRGDEQVATRWEMKDAGRDWQYPRFTPAEITEVMDRFELSPEERMVIRNLLATTKELGIVAAS